MTLDLLLLISYLCMLKIRVNILARQPTILELQRLLSSLMLHVSLSFSFTSIIGMYQLFMCLSLKL